MLPNRVRGLRSNCKTFEARRKRQREGEGLAYDTRPPEEEEPVSENIVLPRPVFSSFSAPDNFNNEFLPCSLPMEAQRDTDPSVNPSGGVQRLWKDVATPLSTNLSDGAILAQRDVLPHSPQVALIHTQQTITLSRPVSFATIKKFDTYLRSVEQSGAKVNRNQLITHEAQIQITHVFKVHDYLDAANWLSWADKKLFEMLYRVYPDPSGQGKRVAVKGTGATLEDRCRDLQLKVNVAVGLHSIDEYSSEILLWVDREGALSEAREKALVELLLKQYPRQQLHEYIRQLMDEGSDGRPLTISDYLIKLGRIVNQMLSVDAVPPPLKQSNYVLGVGRLITWRLTVT